ncbi:alpha/beta hydrolase family protein [Fodinicola feengrottensis]|uniref:alpha/beta hydrolase family protein n=1 Tax=Fodinicola feengrottensis TaxID=435914 RepID=UPI0013D6C681|nr:prolyl oligopeptidase family serine peptidase [Fodinicola feengrottensis]
MEGVLRMVDLGYEAGKPFELTVETVAERPGVVIADCRFENVEGEPVDAYLVSPKDAPARAGVVFQHSTGGRVGFLAEAIRVAEAGGVALSLPVTYQASGEQAPMIRQSIYAIRRGADILLQRTDRIGCVGHSAGAMMAGTVSGLDDRFSCFVFEVGLSGLSFHYRDSQHPMVQAQRATHTAGRVCRATGVHKSVRRGAFHRRRGADPVAVPVCPVRHRGQRGRVGDVLRRRWRTQGTAVVRHWPRGQRSGRLRRPGAVPRRAPGPAGLARNPGQPARLTSVRLLVCVPSTCWTLGMGRWSR